MSRLLVIVVMGLAAVSRAGSPVEIEEELRNSEPKERRQAMMRFSREGLHEYAADESLRIIRTAIRDADDEVRWRAFQALAILINVSDVEDGLRNDQQLSMDIARNLKDDNVDVVTAAALASMALFGDSEATEVMLLAAYLESAQDDFDRRAILERIRAGGIASERVLERLMSIARGDVSRISYDVVTTLIYARTGNLPEQLLPTMIQLVQAPEFLGDPTLVEGVGSYGALANQYVPQLEEIRDRILSETNNGILSRWRGLETDFVLQRISDTITSLRSAQAGKKKSEAA